MGGRRSRLQPGTSEGRIYSYHGKMLQQLTQGRSVNTSFQCSQPLFCSPLVTVNNLGLRRFIALHSKCSRRIGVLRPSYWSNWEDVQQSKRNSWESHRMHGIRKAILAYGGPFKLLFRGLVLNKSHLNPTLPIYCLRILPSASGGRKSPRPKSVYLVSNLCRLLG